MARRFVKYNPSFLPEADLINNFVVRHADLEMILRILSENTTDSNQHILVIGPRGSGKTTLVLRVAAEIDRDAELRERWYPLIFSEESYRATSATDFWLEALSHLASQTGDEKWIRAYNEMRTEVDDQRVGERPLWQLLDFADSQGKKILLIVENLNMLFSDLVNDDEAWKMRHTLINEPRLMLLATATSRFEGIESPSHAMFEMFKMHELKPLDDEECNSIWESVTGGRLAGRQIRPVRILTGGNPRLLAIIAKFGAHRSFRQLLDDLVDLIDDHTDYFKSRLDHMPAIERKVYLALAELWQPSTAREIARTARLDVNKTSSLLNRLAGRGAVVVETQGKKIKWYRIAEGIYNIYYLMRRRGRPAGRVRATVKFMVAMYGHESATRMVAEEACRLSPELCRDHYAAYEEIIKAVQDRQLIDRIITSTPKSFLESSSLNETLKNYRAVGKKPGEEKGLHADEAAELKEAREANDHGLAFGRKGDFEQALATFEQVITRFGSSDKTILSQEVAMALVSKGITLGMLDRPEEAIAAYDKVVDRFVGREEKELAELVARALVNKGVALGRLDRPEQAEEALRRATESAPDMTAAYIELIKLLLEIPERREDALQKANEIINRRPDDPDLLNAMAWEFYEQGSLSLLPEAETWARQAAANSPADPRIRHTLACILCRLGKSDEALESASKYIQNPAAVEKTIEDAIELFVGLAAAGLAEEALNILIDSPSERFLEPLVVGLKLFMGEDVKTAVEILAVAKDVVTKVEEQKQLHE